MLRYLVVLLLATPLHGYTLTIRNSTQVTLHTHPQCPLQKCPLVVDIKPEAVKTFELETAARGVSVQRSVNGHLLGIPTSLTFPEFVDTDATFDIRHDNPDEKIQLVRVK